MPAVYRKGVHPEADAPANERPIEPPSPVSEDVYDNKAMLTTTKALAWM
jgi:hypothetical protein